MELAGKRWILECSSRYVTARDPKTEIRLFERRKPVATENLKADALQRTHNSPQVSFVGADPAIENLE